MRTGDTKWKVWFGPVNVRLEDLTQMSFPRDNGESVEAIRKDIEEKGLKNPLWATWKLEPTILNKLRVFKGNQRLQALKELGWKTAPCLICVKGYEDQEVIKNMLQSLEAKYEYTNK